MLTYGTWRPLTSSRKYVIHWQTQVERAYFMSWRIYLCGELKKIFSGVRPLDCCDFTKAISFLVVPRLFYFWNDIRRRSSEFVIHPLSANFKQKIKNEECLFKMNRLLYWSCPYYRIMSVVRQEFIHQHGQGVCNLSLKPTIVCRLSGVQKGCSRGTLFISTD